MSSDVYAEGGRFILRQFGRVGELLDVLKTASRYGLVQVISCIMNWTVYHLLGWTELFIFESAREEGASSDFLLLSTVLIELVLETD